MSCCVVAARRLVLAVLVVAGGPVHAQGVDDQGPVVVRPARVPVPGSPQSNERQTNLPAPPPGPIESQLVTVPASQRNPPSAAEPVWQTAPEVRSPSIAAVGRAVNPPPAPTTDKTLAVIGFAGQSPNLTDGTRAELHRLAKRIADQRLRHIKVRGFAPGDDLDSRKIALARALVVRDYLVDLGVKARIEVGSFSGDGQHVEILIP